MTMKSEKSSRSNNIFKSVRLLLFFFAASVFADLAVKQEPLQKTEEDSLSKTKLNTKWNIRERSSKNKGDCPSYGCPLLPRDVFYDADVKDALNVIRGRKKGELRIALWADENQRIMHEDEREEKHNDDDDDGSASGKEQKKNGSHQRRDTSPNIVRISEALSVLESLGSEDMATLKLIGYKGGKLEDQTNQDRAFVIAPYSIMNENSEQDEANTDDEIMKSEDTKNTHTSTNRILGVFDGHAPLGEHVSQHVVTELPALLATKLQYKTTATTEQQKQPLQQHDKLFVQQTIVETFIQLDKTAPAEKSGGCTASIILQLGSKIYIANAGDSRSFLATYTKSTNQTNIVYISREDKPDIPEERTRVESMGGEVYVPQRKKGSTSRVLYVDKQTKHRNGLAMSRSIGDWAAGEVGVIPDPIVDVLDVSDIVNSALLGHASSDDVASCVMIDESGEYIAMTDGSCSSLQVDVNDVHIFGVSATDGMLDYVSVEEIANMIAWSLFGDDASQHLLTACEELIMMAAAGWHRSKGGRYRDDIAIAVSRIWPS